MGGHSSVIGIVLAAGKGTRMKSDLPKVLNELFFAPMIHHVLDTLNELSLKNNVVVTGHHGELVEASLRGYSVSFVRQEQQLGTGHAVLMCAEALSHHGGAVLILCGDTPLVTAETLRQFIKTHHEEKAVLTVMTAEYENPKGYGRIVTDDSGDIVKIIEEKDASPEERKIAEVNAGIYCVEAHFLFAALQRVGSDNRQGEYYLTDIVGIASADGLKVRKFHCADNEEVLGVNSRLELAQAHSALQRRHLSMLMAAGVSVFKPDSVTIAKEVTIGKDSLIHPYVSITGKSEIGSGVVIDSFVRISDSRIGEGVKINSFANLEHEDIAPHSIVMGKRNDLSA